MTFTSSTELPSNKLFVITVDLVISVKTLPSRDSLLSAIVMKLIQILFWICWDNFNQSFKCHHHHQDMVETKATETLYSLARNRIVNAGSRGRPALPPWAAAAPSLGCLKHYSTSKSQTACKSFSPSAGRLTRQRFAGKFTRKCWQPAVLPQRGQQW